MALSEEKALEILNQVIKEVNDSSFKEEIKAIVYREDYQDYVVVLSNFCYSEIREKLILDYNEYKHEDVRREIMFKLKHAVQLEEWQLEEMGLSGEFSEEDITGSVTKDGKGSTNQMSDEEEEKRKIAVDDDDKYDWI